MNKLIVTAAALFASTSALTSPAAAQNLVTNGDFATGCGGWTIVSNAANCNAGYYAEGNIAGYGSISQSFAATPGSTLTLDYDFGSGDGSGYVVFNGATVPGSFAGVSPVTHYSFNLGAALASNTLSFFGNNDPSYNFLDNVVVTASAATAAVPEPATWGLLLFGFGAAGASLRYRRRATRVAFAA